MKKHDTVDRPLSRVTHANQEMHNILGRLLLKALGCIYCAALRRVVNAACDRAVNVTEVSGIQVFGPEPFVEGIRECLALVELKDPHGYSLVRRYLKRIVGGSAAHELPRSAFLVETVEVFMDEKGRLRIAWACVGPYLVHCAVLTRCYVGLGREAVLCKNSAYHLVSSQRELLAANRLEAPRYFLDPRRRRLDELLRRNGSRAKWQQQKGVSQ